MPEFKIEIESFRFESFRGDFGSINVENMGDMSKKLGLPLEKDAKGIYVKGEENLYIDEEFLNSKPDEFMTKLTTALGETKAREVNEHLSTTKDKFPTDTERAHSQAASAPSSEAVTNRGGLDTEKPTDEAGKAKHAWFDAQVALSVGKFVLLAGLTVAGLYLINKQNNGCWLINTGTGEKIQRVSSSTNKDVCNLCYDDTLSSGATVCKNSCGGNQAGNCLVNPAIPVFPDTNCCISTSCQCMGSYDTTKTPPVFTDATTNFNFKVVNESVFDTFGGILAGMGAVVTGIVDDVMDIAKDIVGLMNIMWIILIALGGVAVLGLIIWGITEGVKAGKTNKPPDKSLELQPISGVELQPISGGYALTRSGRHALRRLSKYYTK